MMFDLQIIPMDGPAAKPFTLQSLDGRRVSLADQKGKVTLLYFWATW
jgi:cytochrome oxidase Cu insertion factor (SCO1/SenC/PrrC family)